VKISHATLLDALGARARTPRAGRAAGGAGGPGGPGTASVRAGAAPADHQSRDGQLRAFALLR
jgi:hypothetical protein